MEPNSTPRSRSNPFPPLCACKSLPQRERISGRESEAGRQRQQERERENEYCLCKSSQNPGQTVDSSLGTASTQIGPAADFTYSKYVTVVILYISLRSILIPGEMIS